MKASTVGVIGHSCFCPIGTGSREVFDSVIAGQHGMRSVALSELVPDTEGRVGAEELAVARFSGEQLALLEALPAIAGAAYTLFEKICIKVAVDALSKTKVAPDQADCLFVFSTTKGNIDSLRRGDPDAVNLWSTARKITAYFNNPNLPLVISNACISGVLALQTAKRLLEAGRYQHIVVVGGDVLSPFVVAGFHSFHALSAAPCRPFDRDRDGLNLGEAAACMILSSGWDAPPLAVLAGGATSNDANHISGPSRTGAELGMAIRHALNEAGVQQEAVGFLSAHGTATLYNDEMEARAFHLAGLQQAPAHSLKSFIGHTLGAAGIIESVIACMGMDQDQILPSLNYAQCGVSQPLSIATRVQTAKIDTIVKTASGFGGCNAALVWKKSPA